MERVLGKKQSIQNEEWLKAEKRIEELVSREVLMKRCAQPLRKSGR